MAGPLHLLKSEIRQRTGGSRAAQRLRGRRHVRQAGRAQQREDVAAHEVGREVLVVNELRAAGAEAIAINGQRLTGTSEIRCAGPTLSVNNVRSSAPFEIRAIGDKKSLENALRMRGGVAETLGVWGIQLDIKASNDVYIPPYRGSIRQSYARETAEREEESK